MLYTVQHVLVVPTVQCPHLLQAPVLNFCANNYLGLSNHPEVVEAGVQVGK